MTLEDTVSLTLEQTHLKQKKKCSPQIHLRQIQGFTKPWETNFEGEIEHETQH